MGFRTGAFCKIWSVEAKSEACTKVRMSISRKDKRTGEYEQDFSGFVYFIGTAAATKAAKLDVGDRIKLGDVDVSTKYNAKDKVTYYNLKVFNFEMADDSNKAQDASEPSDPQPAVDDGEVDENRELPF